jgi:hypothetical protein
LSVFGVILFLAAVLIFSWQQPQLFYGRKAGDEAKNWVKISRFFVGVFSEGFSNELNTVRSVDDSI